MRASQAVIGFTDALMVAPLGEAALAATTTGGLNVFTFIILPMGTVFIVQSFAAQLRGRGEVSRARRYAWYGLAISAVAALAGVALISSVPSLLGLASFAPEVSVLTGAYVSVRLFAVGAAVGTEALGNWYSGLGNTRLAMVAGVIAMTTNIAGNFLLIEPRFGLPGFGVVGAAWASVVASWLGFGVTLLAFLRGWGYQRTPEPLGLRRREFWRVLRFGLPNGINWFLEFAAFVLFIDVVVANLGTTALAAFNVVIQINSISFMPAFGVASAGAILAGEAIGRRSLDAVWPAVRLALVLTGFWMVATGGAYLLAPEVLLAWFRPRDAIGDGLVEIGTTMLVIAAVWQFFDAASITFSEALRAAGDTTWCMGARIVAAWVVFTPVAWTAVFVLEAGVVTIMLTLLGYVAILAAAFSWRFATGRWRSIEMVEAEPELV
jgi:MATE family multidrug resistance protein